MKASKASYGIAAAVGCALAVLVIWRLRPTDDRDPVAPYADFERDLAAGRIDEVHIDGTEYSYRVRRDSTRRKTTGPKATLASIAAMRPSDSALQAPKVYCERW